MKQILTIGYRSSTSHINDMYWECYNGYHLIYAEGKQVQKMFHAPHAFLKNDSFPPRHMETTAFLNV